jgi:hypothetical protein
MKSRRIITGEILYADSFLQMPFRAEAENKAKKSADLDREMILRCALKIR